MPCLRQVPLNVLTTDADGKAIVDNTALLKTRETTYRLDTDKTWKINAGSTGICASRPLKFDIVALSLSV